MILSGNRYRPVTVLCPTLPTATVLEPKLANFTQRDISWHQLYQIITLTEIDFKKSPIRQNFDPQ